MKTITHVGNHLLKPALALPDQGRLVGIELISEHNKFALLSYVFLSPESTARLYEQYRKFYRSATARWTGKLQGKGREYYAFAIRTQLGEKPTNDATGIVFTISSGTNAEEIKAYRLSDKDKHLTIVSATLSAPRMHDMLLKQSEFTLLV